MCWNTQHKRESWRFLLKKHGDTDLALLQEACTPPPEVSARFDVGPGPWVNAGWNGARAVVGISNRVAIHRIPVADIVASAHSESAIFDPTGLAVAVVTLPSNERLGLVSIESAGDSTERAPEMIREVQLHYGDDLPCIVGGDLNVWPDSETDLFDGMKRIGMTLIGPNEATFYSPMHGQRPADAELQLDYVFASMAIAHRLDVRALNCPDCWGPSDHCRIVIELV